jgi:hypothetical protein
VGADFLIQFERAFYSVPYAHIGARVVVLGSRHTVRIFRDCQEIARHPRASRRWEIVRNPLHAPPRLEEYMNTTSEGLVQWSFRIGQPVGKVAQCIFSDKAVDGMRPVRALLHLAGKYSPQRLIRACERALLYQTPTYRSVKEILVKNLDGGDANLAQGQKSFRFQRRGTDFDPAYLLHSCS